MKKFKVFECFAGIGAQNRAMKNLFNNEEMLRKLDIDKTKIGFEVVGTSEWFMDAIIGYDVIHHGEQTTFPNYYTLDKEVMLDFISRYCLSKDSKTPYDFNKIKKMSLEDIKRLYIALNRNKNLGSILDIKGEELITKTKGVDLLTYSFPCFTAGHKITLKDGVVKNIEDIQKDDLVLTHKNRYKRVVKPMKKVANHIYYIKMIGEDKILEVTEEHPFYVINKNFDKINNKPKWVDVKDLNKDVYFLLKHISKDTISSKKSICGKYELVEIEYMKKEYKEVEVYNFEVEKDNSYVVENIIVHNCQDISLAGKGAGLEVGTRSGLLWEIKRILEELQVLNKLPKFLLMENVKALFDDKHKEGWLIFERFLETLGYKNTTFIANSLDYGIPQSRNRVFCVSELNGNTNLTDFIKTELNTTLNDFLNLNNEAHIEEYKMSIPNNTVSRRDIIEQSKKLNDEKFCFTITTKADRKPNPGVFWCNENGFLINNENRDWYVNGPDITGKSPYRYLTPREALLLMGFKNEDYDMMINNEINRNTIYMFAGNSIVVNVLESIFGNIIARYLGKK